MLRELHFTDLGVIEDLDLELHEGLNVLTGETGAGKTMVTVGLALAIGGRANASLVRTGAKAAKVQVRFDAALDEEWSEDGELVLARTVSTEGKSSARIGGQIATASTLATLGGDLVELHGQHQAQRLLSPTTQLAFLDRFAGDAHVVALASYREVFGRFRDAERELESLGTAARDRERELDLLAYQVREIESVAPVAGESDALAGEEARLAHVERLGELAAEVESALSGEGAASDAVATVVRSLDDAAALDQFLQELASRAVGLAAEVTELARDVRSYAGSLSADPERLQGIRERRQALKALQRKYGETDADVVAFLEKASERLASLTGADERLETLRAEVEELRGRAHDRAARLHDTRGAAAPRLASTIRDELRELGMPEADVRVELEPLDALGPTGADRAELVFSAGPGQSLLPLAKVASGGELSRTMLACRSVLADLDDVPTLVFDEVDAGIGGQAGFAVGRRLASLASTRQVLVVSHLPQIACFADRHIRVEKRGGVASVAVLDDAQRVRELSRMLAGLPESERALSHAEELLEAAGRARA